MTTETDVSRIPKEDAPDHVESQTGKKELTLFQKASRVLTRLKNVNSVKTPVGLRNLRDDALNVVKKLEAEILVERKRADNGDKLDKFASESVIQMLSKKVSTIESGIPGIMSRADVLREELLESQTKESG